MNDSTLSQAKKLAKTSAVMQAAFDAKVVEIADAVLYRAKCGDNACMKLVVERLLPVIRERSINIDLPAVTTVHDLPPAVAAILQRVADGSITPSEGEKLASLLGSWRESVEVTELLRRIAALEERSAGKVAL